MTIYNIWNIYHSGNETTYPKKYGKYPVTRKDGKQHFETWNGSGWAYNNNSITYWMELSNPIK